MISIRTTLVVTAFVGMGLTSAAEYLAGRIVADPEPFVTVGAQQVHPGAIRLTERSPTVPAEIDPSPWI